MQICSLASKTWKLPLRRQNNRYQQCQQVSSNHHSWLVLSSLDQEPQIITTTTGNNIHKRKNVRRARKWQGRQIAPYFQGNTILPILDLVAAVEPKTLSLIVTKLRTRRLAGLKKESFRELLRTAGILYQYFCWQSYTTWDVLLPSEDLARNTIITKYFWLQPKYSRKWTIRVTMCNIPIQLNGDILAAYLSKYGGNAIKKHLMGRHTVTISLPSFWIGWASRSFPTSFPMSNNKWW